MSICKGEFSERLAEAYVQDAMLEEERARFEDHFFDCAACLSSVQAMQAARIELEQRSLVAPLPVPRSGFRWGWQWGAAAAVLVACVLLAMVWMNRAPVRPQVAVVPAPANVANPAPGAPVAASSVAGAQEKLTLMADLRLPPYAPPGLRGANVNESFHSAMQAYRRGDCKAAVAGLAKVEANAGEAVAARFYTGVCRLAAGEVEQAAAALERVISAGDSPQFEASLYMMAQTKLARGDGPQARRYLQKAIALRGDYEDRARAQLGRIAEALGRQ